MCTIISVDYSFWSKNKTALRTRIMADSRSNGDGWALVGLDPMLEENNIRLQTMALSPILKAVDRFFGEASETSRIWLHARFATTHAVGIGFNHGFDDRLGRIIMHNGILRKNVACYAVDSFKFAELDLDFLDGPDLLESMKDEDYANVFIIDTTDYAYKVLRLGTGSLYTDGQGNYSSNSFSSIKSPVLARTEETFYLEHRKEPRRQDWMDYHDYEEEERLAALRWESDDIDSMLALEDQRYVIDSRKFGNG